MVRIKFKYKDIMSEGEWREQECVVKSVEECITLYGLGLDCEYQFVDIKEV